MTLLLVDARIITAVEFQVQWRFLLLAKQALEIRLATSGIARLVLDTFFELTHLEEGVPCLQEGQIALILQAGILILV